MVTLSDMRSNEILDAFQKGIPVRDAKVDEAVQLLSDPFDGAIDCENCHFRSLTAPCVQIQNPVRFNRCSFELLECYATYFLSGLIIEDCTVQNAVTFQSGGHNDRPIIIRNTTFRSVVDFEDCWFTGPILLQNVEFSQGTNLLGNQNTPLAVRFDVQPELKDVRGELDLDTYQTGFG